MTSFLKGTILSAFWFVTGILSTTWYDVEETDSTVQGALVSQQSSVLVGSIPAFEEIQPVIEQSVTTSGDAWDWNKSFEQGPPTFTFANAGSFHSVFDEPVIRPIESILKNHSEIDEKPLVISVKSIRRDSERYQRAPVELTSLTGERYEPVVWSSVSKPEVAKPIRPTLPIEIPKEEKVDIAFAEPKETEQEIQLAKAPVDIPILEVDPDVAAEKQKAPEEIVAKTHEDLLTELQKELATPGENILTEEDNEEMDNILASIDPPKPAPAPAEPKAVLAQGDNGHWENRVTGVRNVCYLRRGIRVCVQEPVITKVWVPGRDDDNIIAPPPPVEPQLAGTTTDYNPLPEHTERVSVTSSYKHVANSCSSYQPQTRKEVRQNKRQVRKMQRHSRPRRR